jgi:ubiquitin-like domain-containing CTD phosphatase 1
VFDLKALLQSLTDVPPERQKILGLVKGKLPPDQDRMCVIVLLLVYPKISRGTWLSRSPSADMKLTPGKKFTLVGTPEGREVKDPSRKLSNLPSLLTSSRLNPIPELEFLPDVVNDLDFDFSVNEAAAAAFKNDQRNIRKIAEATKKLQVNSMSTPFRTGYPK